MKENSVQFFLSSSELCGNGGNGSRIFYESCYSGIRYSLPKEGMIKKVIFNDPATIVIWTDGTKTVVKCSENDIFDPEKGLAMAIVKRAFGNDNSFHKIFKKWLPKEEEDSNQVTFDSLSEAFRRFGETIKSIGKDVKEK